MLKEQMIGLMDMSESSLDERMEMSRILSQVSESMATYIGLLHPLRLSFTLPIPIPLCMEVFGFEILPPVKLPSGTTGSQDRRTGKQPPVGFFFFFKFNFQLKQ